MKKLMIVLLVSGLAISASAQHFSHRGGYGYGYARPRVAIGFGVGLPFYGYSPYYSPYPSYYPYAHRESRLELQIEDIRRDYKDRIWSARHDKSVPRHERKRNIHDLEQQRDRAIIQAKRNYYKY